MARRGIPKQPPAWFLREWMAAMGVTKQSEMMKRTGWSKATMSQLYNGQQDFSTPILEAAAVALNCEPAELLMHPEYAMSMRRFKETATMIAHQVEPRPSESANDAPAKTGTHG